MTSEKIVSSEPAPPSKEKTRKNSTFTRVFRYSLVRLFSMMITVAIGVYLTILIANMGGYVDTIMRNEIKDNITQGILANPAFRSLSTEAKANLIQTKIETEINRRGLNQPFAIRSVRYLKNALTLNLGRAIYMKSDQGSKEVRLILLERLPATLLFTGTSSLMVFFASVYIALSLSRKYGSFWDKIIIAFSPTSAAPPWFYGIFLILIFAAIFKVLPFGGLVDSPSPRNPLDYGLSVLKHLILPISSVVMSFIFLSIYNWRTFFLIYSSEDYVEMAKAKGLSARDVERRYILRPTLPTIITNFALLVITLWTGFTITETVFLWPGLGITLFRAIGFYDTPVIVGSTIIYAYLLAITVFLLDFVYALVDPRVKVGSGGGGSQ
ncbi:MAG: ABC transporter permease [Chloroflexi bacterium GWB2_49_20]|nr:MAG: ABC transporter permease [Chloroflexi bacterium GWB2_49_20]OGN77824.1 MAG: ABC transporter permease [Chloroflexi bacterium GWC2_49_37]OGN86137.1 MAG: ABC transporter permease [Chloroflexi bacterium GWD2_49_16]